jgi:hypothetical protein
MKRISAETLAVQIGHFTDRHNGAIVPAPSCIHNLCGLIGDSIHTMAVSGRRPARNAPGSAASKNVTSALCV